MATADEAALAKTQLAGGLAAGVETLDLNQEVTFTQYLKVVLPLDGFVFWVRADLLSDSALCGTMRINGTPLNQPPEVLRAAATVTVRGSLHYATAQNQNEDETVAINSVVFTSLSPVQDFNRVGPGSILIATFQGVRFAFNQRRSFYQQADLHHYTGNAIYPAMASQVVDSLSGFDSQSPVVSNSLPLWLALPGYTPPFMALPPISFQLYPSFAVPDNLPPPYGSVHVVPESTRALQGSPRLSSDLSHSQLVRETVRITLYGVRNEGALDFLDLVGQYTLDTDNMGIMNMPVMRDDKRTQTELSILAMKKTVEYEVNYYQQVARDVARQTIQQALVTYQVEDQQVA